MRSGRGRLLSVVFGLLVVLGVGLATARYLSLPADITGSAGVEFARAQAPKAKPHPWRTWGGSLKRTRVLGYRLRPPYYVAWRLPAHFLVELPPVEDQGRLYFGNYGGQFYSVDARTGSVLWRYDTGRCIASSPTVSAGVVYVGLMGPAPCHHPYGDQGGVIALDASSGRPIWIYHSGLVESSPLLVGHLLYFGAYRQDGRYGSFYAVDVRNHRRAWRIGGVGKVAGSAAYEDGSVYFGSYNGSVYSVDARAGYLDWQGKALSAAFPSSGRVGFYATPALAYGRVYIGGIDGRMYAFGAQSGALLWASSVYPGGDDRLLRTAGLQGNIYASAAISRSRVFVGSTDGFFYALDAATGRHLWRFHAGGKIIGSAAVMDGLVYFSTTNRHTYALSIYDGKLAWSFDDGGYSPVLADGVRVYLLGLGRLYGLKPMTPSVYGPHLAR